MNLKAIDDFRVVRGRKISIYILRPLNGLYNIKIHQFLIDRKLCCISVSIVLYILKNFDYVC